ncbi:MAG: uncharacterized protein QOD30_982 [Actinomycetota bacterium]|nr:uncharacterized protein [Actinomycetota bacterium]
MNDDLARRVGTLREQLDTPAGSDRLRRVAWAVLAAAVLGLLIRGGSAPADPAVSPSTRVPMSGFGQVAVHVTTKAGAAAEWCALLAANEQQRGRGLMGQHGLNGYAAMVFRYDAPSTNAFWMKDTKIPLTVAFFDTAGHFLNAHDMVPCPEGTADAACPTYPSAAPFTTAIEVQRGGLDTVGVGPGATISFPGGPCPT